ncbi:MAG: hypothetical protein JRD89_01070 [Deltaproteobacteria bacterium]|nr:hypothetical protein [Deltaproteobacteria bacterium]
MNKTQLTPEEVHHKLKRIRFIAYWLYVLVGVVVTLLVLGLSFVRPHIDLILNRIAWYLTAICIAVFWYMWRKVNRLKKILEEAK